MLVGLVRFQAGHWQAGRLCWDGKGQHTANQLWPGFGELRLAWDALPKTREWPGTAVGSQPEANKEGRWGLKDAVKDWDETAAGKPPCVLFCCLMFTLFPLCPLHSVLG